MFPVAQRSGVLKMSVGMGAQSVNRAAKHCFCLPATYFIPYLPTAPPAQALEVAT